MHSTQSTFAVIVSASVFELLNSAGVPVAVLGTGTETALPFIGSTFAALDMFHVDAATTDSALRWSYSNAGNESVRIYGPMNFGGANTGRPRLALSRIAGGTPEINVTLAAGSPDGTTDTGGKLFLSGSGVTNRRAQLGAGGKLLNMTETICDLGSNGAINLFATDAATLSGGAGQSDVVAQFNAILATARRGASPASVNVVSDGPTSYAQFSATQQYLDSNDVAFVRKVDGTSAGRGYGHAFAETVWGNAASTFDLTVADTAFIASGFPNNAPRDTTWLDVRWTFDCELIAAGAGVAVATMQVNGVNIGTQAIFGPTTVGQRQTTSQHYMLNMGANPGAVTITMFIRKTLAGGTLRVYGLHTHMSATLHA